MPRSIPSCYDIVMKLGRNDPCPCGSGKKYKKCCMAKDQAEEAARSASPAKSALVTAPPPEPALSTSVTAHPKSPADEYWEAFEAADSEHRFVMFADAVDQPWLDCEMAAEAAISLYSDACKSHQLARFEEMIALLRQRRPDLYEEEPHTYLDLLISSALAMDQREKLPSLVEDLARTGAEQIDLLERNLDQLAYRGELQLVLNAHRIAWPAVRKSKEVLDWAIGQFSRDGAFAEICAWLDERPEGDPHDPELLKRTKAFDVWDKQMIASAAERLSGRRVTAWTLEDFNLSGPAGKMQRSEQNDEESEVLPGEDNLANLGYEFIAYAHHQEGVPWLKADMAQWHLLECINQWHRGDLTHEGSHRPRSRHTRNILCPPAGIVDPYVAGLVGGILPQYPGPTAMVVLYPAWLRFLRSRGLVDEALQNELLAEMAYIPPNLAKLFRQAGEDPAMVRDLEHWSQ